MNSRLRTCTLTTNHGMAKKSPFPWHAWPSCSWRSVSAHQQARGKPRHFVVGTGVVFVYWVLSTCPKRCESRAAAVLVCLVRCGFHIIVGIWVLILIVRKLRAPSSRFICAAVPEP